MQTGIQVSSFRPVLTNPREVAHAFARMARMGCDLVQIQWIDPVVPLADIRRAMDETCIRSVGLQDFYTAVAGNRQYYYDLNRGTGGTWVTVSRIPEEWKSPSGLDRYVEDLRQMARELEELGQKLCFHPVSADFVPVDGVDLVALLLEKMPELMICADLYHLNKSGKNMISWLEQYRGRVCMVHFKDSRTADGVEELVPAGQGDIDWTGIAAACVEIGVAYAFAEQERWAGDPFDALEQGLAWLNGELKKT